MKTRSTKRSVCRCLLALSATDLKRDGVVRPCADCHIMYSTSGAQGAALSGWTPSSPVCACRSILRWCSRTWPLCRTRAAYSHRIPRDPSGEGGLGVTLQHTAFRRSEPRCAVLLCIPHSCMTVWAAATTCVTRRGTTRLRQCGHCSTWGAISATVQALLATRDSRAADAGDVTRRRDLHRLRHGAGVSR